MKLISSNLRYSKICPRFHNCFCGTDLQVNEIFVYYLFNLTATLYNCSCKIIKCIPACILIVSYVDF